MPPRQLLQPLHESEPLTLPAFLADVATRHGHRRALRFEGRDWSYAELAAATRALARALAAAGVVKGTHVAVWMANRPEWIQATFAVAQLGGVVIPVNTFATPNERDYILGHSDASLLLMQPALLDRDLVAELVETLPGIATGRFGALRLEALPQLRGVATLGAPSAAAGALLRWDELLAGAGPVPDESDVDARSASVTPDDDALIIYTSGTTDRPKGVLHAQRAPVIQSRRFAEVMELVPDDRVFTAQPFFWTAGICMSLGATLDAGATLLLEETFEPGRALERIESDGATTIHAWPHQEQAMAEHADAARRDLSTVRHVEFTSPLAKLAGLEKNVWGTYGSYGLSETFTICTALPASAPAGLRAGTHGDVLPGIELRILDPETGAPLPADRQHEKGEIAVRGVTLMKGYYKVPRELALDADGFFHTGDGGRLDEDWRLHWSGRLKNLLKTGGANVSPLEIESAVQGVPGLEAGVAVGVPHPTLGEAIVLCAVLTGEHPLDREALDARLAELSAYKRPRCVLAFGKDEVSFTANDKIRVKPLREAAARRLARDGVEIAGHRY